MPAVENAVVGIVMGSDSDWPTMQAAAEVLRDLGVGYEAKVVSAHRTPDLLFSYAEDARPGAEGDHRRRRRRRPPAGHARGEDDRAGARGPGPLEGTVRAGLVAVDRADAQGHPGRHVRHRRVRCRERPLFAALLANEDPRGRGDLAAFREAQSARVLDLHATPVTTP